MMNNSVNDNILNNPSLTISKIKFNNNEIFSFNNDDIVLLVGANNVGKSRALKDIKDDILEKTTDKVIIKEIEYKDSNFTEKNMQNYFKNNYDNVIEKNGDYNIAIERQVTQYYDKNQFKNILLNKKIFYKVLFSFLSTENRLNMTSPISYNYIEDKVSLNIMRKLEKDTQAITKLNDILNFCFDKAIDISEDVENNSLSKLYKFGTKEEIANTINANTREARCLLESLDNLNEQGDGIRSAVAILSSLIANEHTLYLIDEPETFLHPPQARILGNNIVELSKNKQCFISTHNIDLIRGILENKSSRIKIIKINRNENNNEFHVIDNKSISRIANDKNLKYSNILNGLFYNTVVLCENESDCKFYSAILEHLDSNIYQNILFCAVGGKDQFKIIIPLLQKLKINYKIIADLDLIDNRENLKNLLNSIEENKYDQILESHNNFLNLFEKETDNQIKKQKTIREEILKLFTKDDYMSEETANKIKLTLKNISHLKLLKNTGKFCLPAGKCKMEYDKIIEFLNINNIYVVECGEIERFITQIDGHGNNWVEKVFTTYPLLEDSVYNDVKEYIKKIFNIDRKKGEANE